ncbi:MAG TPA: glycosyltransferase family 2 protein [Chitinophagaceae bacterium]|nr:glycosyltransferase family 2 protein [Chitinophagaceae bacterium]
MSYQSCSLIIATYNWPAALQLSLESVLKQSLMPDEIVIADDGSTYETKDLIDQYKNKFAIPLKHVWQPDEGYQLARIRNKAIAVAGSNYIIQVDGDLILQPDFIKDHMRFSKENTFVSGTRALLNEKITRKLITGKQAISKSMLYPHLEKKYNALRSKPLSILNDFWQRAKNNMHYVLGCNMAFWKKDLLKVNGYNEAFSGWGKEDNDIASRLINAGVKLRFLKFGAIAYHLHHQVANLSAVLKNEELFKKSMRDKITYVQKGIDQYSSKQ